MGVEATTDAAGHYRLTGLTKAPAYQLYLGPKGVGVPYPKSSFHVSAESPGLEPVKFDVALKRGVVVRGRVTDKATGKPVTGHILAYTFADDPHVSEFPGYREWRGQNTVRIKEDGPAEMLLDEMLAPIREEGGRVPMRLVHLLDPGQLRGTDRDRGHGRSSLGSWRFIGPLYHCAAAM